VRYLSILICALFIISPLYAQEGPRAAWQTYGIVINDTPGNTPQQNPKLVENGAGTYILVWEDGRSGFYNIFCQKIDENGSLLWGKDGIAAGPAWGNQNFSQAVSDGAGGVILVWQDYRNGNSDIYAQRLSPGGALLWDRAGIPVCIASAGQFAPDIISDGAGGAIITWHDYRGGRGEDIYAQRIDSQGNNVWDENGIPISVSTGTQWYPKIASDGLSGAIIAWTDGRIEASDNNIYAQRVDASGKTLWKKDGKAICQVSHNQESPAILPIPGGAILAWNDFRSGNIDIYAQKIDVNGKPLWKKDGVAVSKIMYAQKDPKLSSDGNGGAIVVWTDNRAEKSDIYGQRIYEDGSLAWQANGRPIVRAEGEQRKPEIIKLKTEDWVIFWEDNRSGNNDLFAQKINSSGTPLWGGNGLPIASARELQESPTATLTPTGNVLIAWEDARTGNFDIHSQKISPNGKLLWGKNGKIICQAVGSVVQQNMEMVFNKQGEIILVFEDARSGFFNVYAQKINRAGKLAWGMQGIPVAKVSANQSNPKIVTDARGGVIICWEDHRARDYPKIRVQHLGSRGQKLWESSLSVANVKSRQLNPKLISDGSGGAIVAWQDDRDVLSLEDIYAQKISSKGELLWRDSGTIIISANGNQIDPAMIPDAAGGAILTWTDFRRGDRNPDIYAQRINSKGKTLWGEEGSMVCGAPDVQRNPRIVSDRTGGAIIAWTDKGGGSYDIYAQRMNKNGKPVWMKDGIPLNQSSRTQQNAKFGKHDILVWEDYRYGNWDIFAGAIEPSGKLGWQSEGVPVAMIPHTQYAPQIVPWQDGSVLVVWEDYRSGQQYEIYVQQLNARGESIWTENGIRIKTKDGGRDPKILAAQGDNSFYLFWEDYSNGGRAIYGQRYFLN
jgi:hypothetical protein